MRRSPEALDPLSSLIERARNAGRPVILDGAVGTALDDAGVPSLAGAWTGAAALTHNDLLRKIHADYAAAGADILTAFTFRTSRRAFQEAGLEDGVWRRAISEAVLAAQAAAADHALVAGSMGPLNDCFSPELAPPAETARREHLSAAGALVEAGVDMLLLETFPSAPELIAAAEPTRRAGREGGIPFAASMVTGRDGRLLDGTEPGPLARRLKEIGAGAVGVNCLPHWFVDPALDALIRADIPVLVSPNLGRPETGQGWEGSGFLDPDELARLARAWVERGVSIVGSCCGSSWEHTKALAEHF